MQECSHRMYHAILSSLSVRAIMFAVSVSLLSTPVWAGEMIFPIPSDLGDLRIGNPFASQGGPRWDCVTGPNSNNLWSIDQWWNAFSLCNDTNNAPNQGNTLCAGADLARETTGGNFCLWKQEKKVRITVNSNAMPPNGGCNSEDPANPGGYSIYFNQDFADKTAPHMSIANMDKLVLSTIYSTDSFTGTACPGGIPNLVNNGNPFGFAYMYVILGEFTPDKQYLKNAMFYEPILYDNRPEWQQPGIVYENCGLPTSTGMKWYVIGEPIGIFNSVSTGQSLHVALPGNPPTLYDWDILPRIKYYYQRCTNSTVDFNNVHLRTIVVGNELRNNASMTITFTDPKVRLLPKNTPVDGYLDGETSPGSCTIQGWACDPDAFDKPITIEFYDGTTKVDEVNTLIDRGEGVGTRCGGYTTRGYQKRLTLSGGTHQIIAKAVEYDSFGAITSSRTSLPVAFHEPNTQLSITCPILPTPSPIPGDLNNDRKVNVTDLISALAQSPLSIFTYTLVAGNYGR